MNQTVTSKEMNALTLLDYECAASSWWLGWIGIGWMQDLAAKYMARKVNRKLRALSRQQKIRAQLRFKGFDV